jgi:dethiobiotin synthetase
VRIVVSGTGTEVGKTWVARMLATRVRGAGYSCVALKPVESGGDEDSKALADACAKDHADALYRFAPAVGPHLAAQRAGVEIDLQSCCDWVRSRAVGADVEIVELAGGLLSPLQARQTNADLLRRLNPEKWIAVASDRLGVLHEVKALMLCAQVLGLAAPIVVLDEPEHADASTGTNESSLRWAGTCEVVARFQRGPGAAAQNALAADRLIEALGLTRRG